MPASSLLDKTGVLKTLPKFKLIMNPKSYRMAHPIYKKTDIETIKKYHHEPEGWKDRLALAMVRTVRGGFDMVSRYNPETMNERDWLNRIVFLETVAGVPGMIGGMVRHLKSLRTLEKDHGWIHHLLQEAENASFHFPDHEKSRSVFQSGNCIIISNIFQCLLLHVPHGSKILTQICGIPRGGSSAYLHKMLNGH